MSARTTRKTASRRSSSRKSSSSRKKTTSRKSTTSRKGPTVRKTTSSRTSTTQRKSTVVRKSPAPPTKPARPEPAPADLADDKRRMRTILSRLEREYPDARCSLDYETPLQLVIATILSAQCTDARVNMVTPQLFRRYPTAQDLAQAEFPELEEIIRSTGFFRNKAKSIVACAQELVESHGGEVPRDLDSLVQLAGIGRKTANVVLGNAFGIPGVVVDTHVGRISRLLNLTAHQDPNKIERDLMQIVPKAKWTALAHLFIEHGRRVCIARRPRCAECVLNDLCPSSEV